MKSEMIIKEALESCSVQARGNVGPARYFFLFLSWLVALCTSGFIITVINKGYDILLASYWQVLDSFLFFLIIKTGRKPWLQIRGMKKSALDAAACSEKRSWSRHTPQGFWKLLAVGKWH